MFRYLVELIQSEILTVYRYAEKVPEKEASFSFKKLFYANKALTSVPYTHEKVNGVEKACVICYDYCATTDLLPRFFVFTDRFRTKGYKSGQSRG